MKKLILRLSFLLLALTGVAREAWALSLSDLKTGDVLLFSMNCYECRIIESETHSAFSHSGIVLRNENNEVRIAQSLGQLNTVDFIQFTQRMTPGTSVHVYRPKEWKSLAREEMWQVFNEKFKGAPFDSKYLWNNVNENGVELLYCSEFIAKFLDYFLEAKTLPLPMSYKKHYDYWQQYFRGVVPDGELGNSPASFSRDERFEFAGTL